MTSDKISAWHFVKDDGHLMYDMDHIKVVAGLELEVDKDRLQLCTYGLHASIKPLDALEYAPGATVCRVELSGRILHGDDKVVASKRKVLAMADATRTLHEFAIRCTEQAMALIDNPDPRSLEALRVKRLWLEGEATDDELDAAWDAAWAATRDATRDAALAAAWDATRAATRDAALAAARAATRDEVWSAAWAAAWGATRDEDWAEAWGAQNTKLEFMLGALFVAVQT